MSHDEVGDPVDSPGHAAADASEFLRVDLRVDSPGYRAHARGEERYVEDESSEGEEAKVQVECDGEEEEGESDADEAGKGKTTAAAGVNEADAQERAGRVHGGDDEG